MVSTQELAAWTGLAAVIVSPISATLIARLQLVNSSKIADRQIKASIISASRQRWIDNVRDTVADIQAILIQLRLMSQIDTGLSWQVNDQRHELIRLKSRLALLLNREEVNHKALLIKIDEYISISSTPPEKETPK